MKGLQISGNRPNAIRIPPLPEGIILHDRADNTPWLLSHTTNPPAQDGFGYVAINDAPLAGLTPPVYEAFSEPYVEILDPREKNITYVRIFVRDGYLGQDMLPFPIGVVSYNNAPTQSKRGVTRMTDHLYAPLTWREVAYVLAWSPEVLT